MRIKESPDVDSGSFSAERKIKADFAALRRRLPYFEKQEKYSNVFLKAFKVFRQNHCTSGKPKFKVSLDPSCQVLRYSVRM